MNEPDQRKGTGRRRYDPPGVPLREHLETLIRGSQVKVEIELADLAEKVGRIDNHVHQLRADVAALRMLEERRLGGTEERARAGLSARGWLQWLPSLIAALAAIYVAFFA